MWISHTRTHFVFRALLWTWSRPEKASSSRQSAHTWSALAVDGWVLPSRCCPCLKVRHLPHSSHTHTHTSLTYKWVKSLTPQWTPAINHFPSWEARTEMLNWHNWEKLSNIVSFQGLYCIYSYVKLTSRSLFWFHLFDLDGRGSTHGFVCRDPTVRVHVHLSCLFICPRCWRLILWFCHWPLGPLLRLLIPVSDCLPCCPSCSLSGWYAGRFPIRSHVLTGTRPLEGAGIVMAPGDLFLLQ